MISESKIYIGNSQHYRTQLNLKGDFVFKKSVLNVNFKDFWYIK